VWSVGVGGTLRGGNVIRVTSRLACIRGGGDPTKPGTAAAKVRPAKDYTIALVY